MRRRVNSSGVLVEFYGNSDSSENVLVDHGNAQGALTLGILTIALCVQSLLVAGLLNED